MIPVLGIGINNFDIHTSKYIETSTFIDIYIESNVY